MGFEEALIVIAGVLIMVTGGFKWLRKYAWIAFLVAVAYVFLHSANLV